jgi:hypothetical protein
MDSSSEARHLLAGLLDRFEAALCTFLSPHFEDVTKSIQAKLRSVSGVFVGIRDPYLFGRLHVLISSWSEEIRELTTSDTFDYHESLVVAGAAGLLEKFFATLLKPNAMDAFPCTGLCTHWMTFKSAG